MLGHLCCGGSDGLQGLGGGYFKRIPDLGTVPEEGVPFHHLRARFLFFEGFSIPREWEHVGTTSHPPVVSLSNPTVAM